VNAARRQGSAVDTQQKCKEFASLYGYVFISTLSFVLGGAGSNKQHQTTKNTAKLDRETDELKHDKVPMDVGRMIQQGRIGKGWSQKELATKINEKPQIINDYEAGRAIPNQAIIGKIERAIGMFYTFFIDIKSKLFFYDMHIHTSGSSVFCGII